MLCLYFDEKSGKQREIKYATNQDSPLVDEQKGECATMGHIRFEDGFLKVPKKTKLTKTIIIISSFKRIEYTKSIVLLKKLEDELEDLDLQIDALNAARSIDIDHAEAILRVEKGSEVNNMSSKEIKRDLLLFARKDPSMFISLANDENVQLRNFAIKAREAGIINLSADQRTFTLGN